METDNVPKPKLWELQPNESSKAFSYFCRYRDMGAGRTIPKVAAEVNKATITLDQMSQKWHWVKRARAWDDEVDKQKRDIIIREVQEMAKRHVQESMIFQRVLVLPAEALLNRAKQGKIKNFNGLKLEKLFDKAVKAAHEFSSIVDIERKSRGEPNEIVNGNITSEIRVIRPPNLINNPKDKTDNDN